MKLFFKKTFSFVKFLFLILLPHSIMEKGEYCRSGASTSISLPFHALHKDVCSLVENLLSEVTFDLSHDCAMKCLQDPFCAGYNFRLKQRKRNCQLTHKLHHKFHDCNADDKGWIFYHPVGPRKIPCNKMKNCKNGGKTIIDPKDGPDSDPYRCQCARGYSGDLCEIVLKTCLDVQTYSNSRIDGEYSLQLSYPVCNQTVQIYCADMGTSQPQEYLTLKAGSTNNFSKKNYVGSKEKNKKASSNTAFSKIRILSDLKVECSDYQFATVTWHTIDKVYIPYAFAADCHAYSCSTIKNGIFKMDLKGTGMRFVTPINWYYKGYRACSGNTPNHYSVSATKQVVSGRCGGYCGSCRAKELYVEPEGC